MFTKEGLPRSRSDSVHFDTSKTPVY
nr:unnamed protein product [Callosobruchus analis]